jgi:hypothetical protein
VWMKRFGMVIGVAWLAYTADLLIRETVSVISGPLQFPSYVAVLVQVAVLLLAGVLLILSLRGRATVSALVALYVGFGHFIFLSNTWYEPGFETWLAIAVVALALLTLVHAVLLWIGVGRNSPQPLSSAASK